MSSDILIKMPATAHSILIVPGMPVLGRWQFQFPNNRGDLRVLPQMACTIPAKCPRQAFHIATMGRTTTADFLVGAQSHDLTRGTPVLLGNRESICRMSTRFFQTSFQAFIPPLDETPVLRIRPAGPLFG